MADKVNKVLVKIDPELWARMKAKAAIEGRPVFAVLATACRDYLKPKAAK